MPKYRVLEPSFINNTLYPEGAEIEYDGEEVAPNLELIEDEGKPAKKSKDDAALA